MSEAEERWIGLSDVPSIADERWLGADQEWSNNGSGPEDADGWIPVDLSSLDDHPPLEPTLGGLGLVYPGKRHVFSGPQESAKTLIAYAIALQVVREGGKVLLIDFEMGQWDARNRLRELGATQDELKMIPYVDPPSPATPTVMVSLVALEPTLVLIDAAAGAYDLQELDDNKRSDVERFTSLYVKGFWKADIASIVLDHVVKNVEGRGKYAIGSERKVGGADVHLGFEVVKPIKRGGTGHYKIVTHKDRGGFLRRGKLADVELNSDPDTHSITWTFKAPVETDEEHPFRPTGLMEKVSRFLERHMEPIAKNEILRADLGKDEYVREALRILQNESYVEETNGPNRSLLQTSIVSYREDDDDHVPSTSQVRPGTSPEVGDPGTSVRPSPYGGTHGTDSPDGTDSGTSRPHDGIPF